MIRRRGVAGEEPSALAGWLYADLLLALVVVGFATAWITQSSPPPPKPTSPPSSVSTTTTTSTTTTAPDGPVTFQLSCDEMFIGPEILGLSPLERDAQVRNLVEEAKLMYGWKPDDAKPAIVLLYGGHQGDAAKGERAAALMGDNLRKELPDLFGRVEMRSGGATSVNVNGQKQKIGTSNTNVGMLIYFVYQGSLRMEDCTA